MPQVDGGWTGGRRVARRRRRRLRPHDGDGRHYGRVWFYRDVTELVRRERELERQDERLDDVVDIVAHDLRGPPNVAQGQLELARAECESDRLEAVGNAHERMETLVDDLLDWARQDGTAVETEPVALGTVVEGCWRNVSATDATLDVDEGPDGGTRVEVRGVETG